MAKATKEQIAESKAAKMKAAAKDIKPYKHGSKIEGTVTGRMSSAESNMTEVDKADTAAEVGVDNPVAPVVESGFSIFNQTQKDTTMTEDTTTTEQAETKALTKQEQNEAAAKAKIAAKQAKLDAAAKAKAEREQKVAEKAATKIADTEKHAAEVAARKAEREQKAGETKAEHEARVAELVAAGRTYTGSMLALADRVKQGVYVKGLTGQLRSTDELAVALDAVPVGNVIKLCVLALGTFMPADELAAIVSKYAILNVGQQSMNLRNRLRGAIKANKITLGKVKELRDENGFATAEDEATKRAEAKAAKEEAAANAKVVKAALIAQNAAAKAAAAAAKKAAQVEPEAATA